MKGSEWSKWDLHIHTPMSIYQKYGANDTPTWDKYILELENLSPEFKVLGINDYLFLEGYKKLKSEQDQNGKLKNLTLLPVVEFRIEKFAGIDFGQLKRINLHVIFSNEVSIETIQSQFLNTLEQSYFLESGSQWTRAITPESVEELGKQIKASIPATELSKYGSDLTEGFNNLNVKEDKIFESLKKDCFQGKYLIAIGKTEWGDLKWTNASIATKKSIINQANIVFTASEAIIDFEKAKAQLKTQGVNDNLLDCSDAHYFSNSVDKDRIGNCLTWIKSEPTFEGLKQILYEQAHRVKIANSKPREPLRKIDSIKFDFPQNTFIKRINSNEKQLLCLNNLKQEIFFSSYFTCLVGGRGTGKSTIINLLGERLNEKTDFFRENNLIIDDKEYDIENDSKNLIQIKGTNEIEFVSQGKIEKLAEGNELTNLIFNERIKETESGFYPLDNEFEAIITLIDESIKLLFSLENNRSILKEKQKESATTKNVIDSVNDERYKIITARISEIRKEINAIKSSSTRYEKLINSLKNILLETSIKKTENEFESRIESIIDLIQGLEEFKLIDTELTVKIKEFDSIKIKIDELTKEFVIENDKLRGFFQEKGTSEEIIKDSQKANENLSRINVEIEATTLKIDRITENFKENNTRITKISELKTNYLDLINSNLLLVNSKLQIDNENVLNINFSYEFNKEEYQNSLFSEFYDTFSKFHISGTSSQNVKDVLFLIDPNDELLKLDYKTFIGKLDTEIELHQIRRANNYVKIVLDIFASQINFVIYKLLINKHFNNVSKYALIKGFYGNKELQNCSFGQRCTAVIVTLLMTGVKPLVIDEPEAHLDNRLIADYLVHLIKTKKIDRQIIFATHNSNFVINGDSELIHILEIPNASIYTNLTSTTIENTANRDKLLKLEGGREAFKAREKKYGIHR